MIKKTTEIIVVDTAGVALMILGLILSPVPGPWSIPLYILGLSLLGRNHHWARRIFTYFNEKGEEILPAKYAKWIIPLMLLLFVLVSVLTAFIYYQFVK